MSLLRLLKTGSVYDAFRLKWNINRIIKLILGVLFVVVGKDVSKKKCGSLI